MAADRIKGITVEINGDATGLSKSLKDVNTTINQSRQALNDVKRLLKLDPKNTELLEQKQKILATTIEETRNKLDKLKEAEAEVQKQFSEGKVSEEQYNALKREIIDTEQKLKDLEKQAETTGKALGTSVQNAGKLIQNLGKTGVEAGKKLTTHVTAPIVGIGKASMDAWNEVDAGLDTIVTKTGASGAALEEMQGIMKNLAVTIPTDFGVAGAAVGEVNTRFGSMGDELQDLSDYFIRFAELNETDVSQSVDSVQASMAAFKLESGDAKNVLDTLNKAGQDTGIQVIELSDEITKNSQKMKDLGFSYSDAAFFLANLSKNGIESSTVMSGLAKAQANAAKDGKTLRESLKDLQKKMKDAGSRTEATQEIMELFGTKAGTQLADALATGQLSFDSFGESLDAFSGNVKQTFEAIQDPPDRLKVAMNALKVSGAELADSAMTTVAPMLERLAEAIRNLTERFNALDEKQKQTIVFWAAIAAAAGPVIVAVGTLVASFGKIVGAIGAVLSGGGKLYAMLTGTGAAAEGTGGILAALAGPGGPILLAVGAVAALAAVFVNAKNDASGYKGELKNLTDAEEENKRKIEELHEAYTKTQDMREAAIGTANREAEQERNLWQELQNITDENGRVKEGYEERASVIIGQLQKALGIEIDMTDGVIKKYGELEQSIDGLIEKKRAEAILSAYQESYAEALRNSKTAQAEYAEAQQNAARTSEQLAEKRDALTDALSRQGAIQGEVNAHNIAAQQENNRLIQTINELRPQIEDLNTKYAGQQETLRQAEEAYTGYQTVIANTEAIQAAIDGNGNLQEALMRAEVGFQTAETGTRESLQRQADDFRAKYAAMKAEAESGTSAISTDSLAAWKKLADDAQTELDRLPTAVTEAMGKTSETITAEGEKLGQAGASNGTNYTEGLKQGIEAGADGAATAATAASEGVVNASAAGLGVNSPSIIAHEQGVNWDEGLRDGIAAGAELIFTAVDTVAQGVATRMSTALQTSQTQVTSYQSTTGASWQAWSQNLLTILTTTFTQMASTTTTGIAQCRQTIETNLQQIRAKWDGQWKAIELKHQQEMQSIRDKNREGMQDVRTTVDTEMTATSTAHRQKMEEMKTSTQEGMTAMLDSVKAKAAEFKPTLQAGVEPGTQYLKDLIPLARKWGDDFMSNYIAAVRERLSELEEVCEEAADIVSDYLECSRPDKGPMHTYPIWGKDFMEGYAESIKSNQWRVLDQMTDLTGKMQQAMAGEGNTGRPYVLNTTSQTILDGKVLAETVNEQLGVIL